MGIENMQERRFRVGIIGLGEMGHHLAHACRTEPGALLAAGCDVVAESRRAWAAAWDVDDSAVYADYTEMLDRERLDVMMVATHAPLHHGHVMAAIERGMHVFCEKPLALSLREADEIVAAAAAAGVKVAVNHIKRGSRGNAIIGTLLADGVIGTPYLYRGEGKGRRWAGTS